MERHPHLLRRESSVLVVVDIQSALVPVLHAREGLVARIVLLCQAARLLEIPVLATTQNAARLGGLLPPVAEALGSAPVFDKMTFSCAGVPAFVEALAATGRTQALLCGAETHICIAQTAHDLVHAGYQVQVAADAVSSRTLERHKLGMERIRDAGILPTAAEGAVYEWLCEAGTPAFRALLPLVRSL